MTPGDEFVASSKLYGGSINQFNHSFKNFGWNVVWADPDDISLVRARDLADKTKAIFIESIANPGGVITDIEAIANIARKAGVPLIVDNTLATPYLCKPIDYGADIVVHSLTKFLGGHGNSIGGMIVDGGTFNWSRDKNYPMLCEPRPEYSRHRAARDLRQFRLRHRLPRARPARSRAGAVAVQRLPDHYRHRDAAAAHAAPLRQRAGGGRMAVDASARSPGSAIPGLAGDNYHALAKKYVPKGAGAVFTFGLKGGYDAGVKLVSKVKLFSHLANIGDTRSLIIHPASTTHRQLSDEQKIKAGAGPDVVRLSVGIEDIDDIIADLEQALAAV